MSDVYVFDKLNNRYPSMSKEQILAAIAQAVEAGEIKDVDAGFVTTVKEQNKATGLKFWVGTQAEYNAIAEKETNCFYIVTDDTFGDDVNNAVEEMQKNIEAFEKEITAVNEKVETKQTNWNVGDIGTLRFKKVGDIVNIMGNLTWQPEGAEIGGGWVGFEVDEPMPYIDDGAENKFVVPVEYTDGVAYWYGVAIVRFAIEKNKIYLRCDETGVTKAMYYVNISYINVG